MDIFDHILKVEKQTPPDTLMERHFFNIDEKQCLITILKVKVSQSCPTLCDPMDCNLPGSSVHGILQARTLEWVAIPFSGYFPNPRTEPTFPTLILCRLSHQGSPRILEWVAYPFSSGSSRPRNQTGVSCPAGGFFTS